MQFSTLKMIFTILAIAVLALQVTGASKDDESFFLIAAYVPNSSTGGSIIRMEPGTYHNRAIRFPLTLYSPIAVDYDPTERKIYWSEVGLLKRIRQANLGGSGMRTVFSKPNSVIEGLAVDGANAWVFYTDTGRTVIGKLDIKRAFAEQIIISSGLDKPRAIVLDTDKQVMFWTDRGQSPKIERANYDGSSRHTLVSSGLKDINALALDSTKTRLYWVDAGTDHIGTSDTSGNDRSTIRDVPPAHRFFGVAFYQGSLYVTNWEASGSNASASTNQLYRVYEDGASTALPKMNYGRLNDIHAYSGSGRHTHPKVAASGLPKAQWSGVALIMALLTRWMMG